MSDYWSQNDPYCYAQFDGVLINWRGITDNKRLREAETAFVEARAR
jgi:fido (protein-threonine AMPylation protein)